MATPPVVLSIAGFDPSSGAGITGDIKISSALGCYTVCCITALTVQSSRGVFQVESVQPRIVSETLRRLAEDVEITAVRIGMLGSEGVAQAVAEFLEECRPPNIVLDPVVRSSSGAELLDNEGVVVLRQRLLKLCDLVTPNVYEAAFLAGADPVSTETPWQELVPNLRALAARWHDMGARSVVITGGHLHEANDFLSYTEDGQNRERVYFGRRIESNSTHGTGCAFAMATACELAKGAELPKAVGAAKKYVRKAIESAYPVGKGRGPLNHMFR